MNRRFYACIAAAMGLVLTWVQAATAPPAQTAARPADPRAPAEDGPGAARVESVNAGDDQPVDRVADARRGVLGGPHDFSTRTGRLGDACAVCHVPHVQGVRLRIDGQAAEAGQGDRAAEGGLPSPDRQAVIRPAPVDQEEQPPPPETTGETPTPGEATALELYRIAGQRQVFVAGRYMPGATSLICLGCHDGTVAVSVLGASHALLAGQREGFDAPDGFVWRDHPIGVPYPTDRGQYHPRAAVETQGVRLPDGRMECVSCHDPHNEHGGDNMLIMSNRRSALCLTCHVK